MPELLARAARSVDERFCKLLIRAGHRANPEGYKHERALGLCWSVRQRMGGGLVAASGAVGILGGRRLSSGF